MTTKEINQLMKLSNRIMTEYLKETDDDGEDHLTLFMRNMSDKVALLLKHSKNKAIIVWAAIEAMNDDCWSEISLSEFEDLFPYLTSKEFYDALVILIKNHLARVEKDDNDVVVTG